MLVVRSAEQSDVLSPIWRRNKWRSRIYANIRRDQTHTEPAIIMIVHQPPRKLQHRNTGPSKHGLIHGSTWWSRMIWWYRMTPVVVMIFPTAKLWLRRACAHTIITRLIAVNPVEWIRIKGGIRTIFSYLRILNLDFPLQPPWKLLRHNKAF